MAYIWFNFRNSLGYISDGADGVWNGGGNGTNSVISPLTGSWNSDRTGSTENGTTSFGPHLAGCVTATSGGQQFTISGFTAGVAVPTKIIMSKPNPGTNINCGWVLLNAADDSVATGGAGWSLTVNDGFCADAAGNNNVSFATMQSTLGTAVNVTPSGTALKLTKNTNSLIVMSIGFDVGGGGGGGFISYYNRTTTGAG